MGNFDFNDRLTKSTVYPSPIIKNLSKKKPQPLKGTATQLSVLSYVVLIMYKCLDEDSNRGRSSDNVTLVCVLSVKIKNKKINQKLL